MTALHLTSTLDLGTGAGKGRHALATRSRKQSGEARVLVVARPALAELVRVTLAHGPYLVETMSDVADAEVRKLSWRGGRGVVCITPPARPLPRRDHVGRRRRRGAQAVVAGAAGHRRHRPAGRSVAAGGRDHRRPAR